MIRGVEDPNCPGKFVNNNESLKTKRSWRRTNLTIKNQASQKGLTENFSFSPDEVIATYYFADIFFNSGFDQIHKRFEKDFKNQKTEWNLSKRSPPTNDKIILAPCH